MPPLVEHSPHLARRRALLATAALAAIAALPGCARRPEAPVFEYTLLDGSRAHSSALKGQVLLVNFWATSCAICMAEMPEIVALHRRLQPRGLQTLAVAMPYDPPARVSMVAEAHRLPFGVVIDNTGRISQAFGDVEFTPTSVLIDRQGRIVRRWTGAPDFAALGREIEGLLAEA